MLYQLLKPLLFSLDPEAAHIIALDIARLGPVIGRLTGISHEEKFSLPVGSCKWSFPVGLAAGLDKNAEALKFFSSQGFGAIECGTITLKPQAGNPRPRMFRYAAEESLRNAMGFPNHGLSEILPRLRAYEKSVPLGVNLGKNKDTTALESIDELSHLVSHLKDLADYFVVNVSSPNTPGLRALQEKGYLTELFTELNRLKEGKDLYLKIAPDLSPEKIRELTIMAADMKLTGIIATNTTLMPARGVGGVSGRLLKERARTVQNLVLQERTSLELIAVGGFSDPKHLFELWDAGGKVAQVYTAYVYQGPELLKSFKNELVHFLQEQDITLTDFFLLTLEERRYRLRKKVNRT